jgi:glutathionylspermidine synthase
MFREQFGAYLAGSPTRWLEPPWKAILSNKGILPLLWAMFPRHPNLLFAWFDDATLPRFADNYVAFGSWIAAGQPCGLSAREDLSPITKNTSRFLPHAIVG